MKKDLNKLKEDIEKLVLNGSANLSLLNDVETILEKMDHSQKIILMSIKDESLNKEIKDAFDLYNNWTN